MKLLDVFDHYPDALKIADILKDKGIRTTIYYLASDQNTSLNEYKLDPQLNVLRVTSEIGRGKPWAPTGDEVKCGLWVVEDEQYHAAGYLLIDQHRQPVADLSLKEFVMLLTNKANYVYIPTTSFDNDAAPRVNVFTVISVQAVLGVFALLYFTWFDPSMRVALVFLLGVFMQSFLMMRGVTGLLSTLNDMGAAIAAAFIASAISLPMMGNVGFTVIFGIAYMLIYSILFMRKFLFVLTRQSFVLFNIIFLFDCLPYAYAGWVYTVYSGTSLIIAFSILIISAGTVFLSYTGDSRLPIKIKNVGTYLYIWYSIMSIVLLMMFIGDSLNGSAYLSASLPIIFLVSMLWMKLLQNIVSVYICVNVGATKLLDDKYISDDNRAAPMMQRLFIPGVILVLCLNFLFFHVDQLMLVNIILLLDGYVNDKYSKSSQK